MNTKYSFMVQALATPVLHRCVALFNVQKRIELFQKRVCEPRKRKV